MLKSYMEGVKQCVNMDGMIPARNTPLFSLNKEFRRHELLKGKFEAVLFHSFMGNDGRYLLSSVNT